MKAAELAKTLNKVLGTNAIRMGDDPAFVVKWLPVGVLPIDVFLQGGLPRGRWTEIYGDWSTLKSYIGLCAIAACQRLGGVAALVDTEHAFDPQWAASLGVDVRSLILPPTTTGEEAVDATEALVAQGVDLVVWDSVAATNPKAEANTQLAKNNPQPARLAALMSMALRKINAQNSHTALLCINQTRLNVGMTFGDPTTTPGGKALPFYASYRIEMRKAGRINRKEINYDSEGKGHSTNVLVGQHITMRILKSKLNKPYRDTLFTFDLTTGRIDELGWLISTAIQEGQIKKAGTGWQYGGAKYKTMKALRTAMQDPTQYQRLVVLAGGEKPKPLRRVVRRRA